MVEVVLSEQQLRPCMSCLTSSELEVTDSSVHFGAPMISARKVQLPTVVGFFAVRGPLFLPSYITEAYCYWVGQKRGVLRRAVRLTQ